MFRFPVPMVSAIIERERDGEIEVLVQTRRKPGTDPKYSGTLEIPAGTLENDETVHEAVQREVFEETGLRVLRFKPDVQTRIHTQRGDRAYAFVPFCCQQDLGDRQRVGFVFLCEVEDQKPVSKHDEATEARWMKQAELRRIVEESPEQIFIAQLGVLDYYLNGR